MVFMCMGFRCLRVCPPCATADMELDLWHCRSAVQRLKGDVIVRIAPLANFNPQIVRYHVGESSYYAFHYQV